MRGFVYCQILALFGCGLMCCSEGQTTADQDADVSMDEPSDDSDSADDLAVFQVIPGSGPTSGGQIVTVIGQGFPEKVALSFGTGRATDIEVDRGDRIVCRTPLSDREGAVDVVVEDLTSDRRASLDSGYTYSRDRPEVEECWLEIPLTLTAPEGNLTPSVYGLVKASGVPGKDIRGELGFGPVDSDPTSDPNWQWTEAEYDLSLLQGDRYRGTMISPEVGQYHYTFRFSSGIAVTFCDSDGSSNGFSSENTGLLTVTEGEARHVDWCNLQHPHSLELAPGSESEMIYGRVFEPGVTQGPGQGEGVIGQVGFGPDDGDPSSDQWEWFNTEYNVDDGGNNDEYMGRITAPAEAGLYDFAFRFSLDSEIWIYCDSNGSTDGYSTSASGSLTVEP